MFKYINAFLQKFKVQEKEDAIIYPAVFAKEGERVSVIFPDIPEAITQGSDILEAFEEAKAVLNASLKYYDKLPKASDVKQVKKKYRNACCVVRVEAANR